MFPPNVDIEIEYFKIVDNMVNIYIIDTDHDELLDCINLTIPAPYLKSPQSIKHFVVHQSEHFKNEVLYGPAVYPRLEVKVEVSPIPGNFKLLVVDVVNDCILDEQRYTILTNLKSPQAVQRYVTNRAKELLAEVVGEEDDPFARGA